MRFLLLFVSFLFSFILYVFYTLSESKGIFWWNIENGAHLQTLLPFSLLYTSIFFFILWGILFFYLSDFKKKETRPPVNIKELFLAIKNNFKNIIAWIWCILLQIIFLYVFTHVNLEPHFIALIYLLISVASYFLIPKMRFFIHKKFLKKASKYMWVISVYISILFWIFYYFQNEWNLPMYILFSYFIAFNFYIHFRFKNYISLFFGIISLLFFAYKIYIKIY